MLLEVDQILRCRIDLGLKIVQLSPLLAKMFHDVVVIFTDNAHVNLPMLLVQRLHLVEAESVAALEGFCPNIDVSLLELSDQTTLENCTGLIDLLLTLCLTPVRIQINEVFVKVAFSFLQRLVISADGMKGRRNF